MLPFRDDKIELLRNHIDKAKSILQLLVQALIHAHKQHPRSWTVKLRKAKSSDSEAD
jgi:hypothetical protein